MATGRDGSVNGLLLHQDYDSRKNLSPGRLDRILDQECGARLTVVMVGACHSGVFIGRASKGDNRIWLTAARDDRVSFGCGAEYQYTYFDECVLGAWPKSRTWAQLFDRTDTCVRLKESELSQASSMPQAFFGKAVKDLALPRGTGGVYRGFEAPRQKFPDPGERNKHSESVRFVPLAEVR